MNIISIYEAKSKLSQIIRELEETKGKVVICKNGKPVADLMYHQKKKNPLEQRKELLGAEYLVDPCEGAPSEDWPEDLR